MGRERLRRITHYEDTCEGRYPSPIVASCARGKVQRWAPASAGAGGGKCFLPQTPYPRRMPGSPAEATRSQPHETPACAGEAGRGDFVIAENPAGFVRDPDSQITLSLYWVPDICSRKFRDDEVKCRRRAGYGSLPRPTTRLIMGFYPSPRARENTPQR